MSDTVTAGEVTTIQARGVQVEKANEIRRYAASQGILVGDVFGGAWTFRREVVNAVAAGTCIDADWLASALARAGVPLGKSL